MANKKSKRANGEGSICKVVKTKNGKKYEYWQALVTIGTDANGTLKRKSISASSQAELIKKMNALKSEVDSKTYTEPSKMTVKQWSEVWLKDYLVDVKYRTVDEYRRILNNHVLPVIGNRKLVSLTGADIQSLINGLTNHRDSKPLSPKTKKDIHTCLHSCLETAYQNDFIKRNPADKTKLPKVKQKEIVPLSESEITAFLCEIQGHKYEALFTVALFTGMRESELCGLTWDCLNFKNDEITVKQQIQKQDGEMKLVETKTDKVATITVASSVMDILQDIRTEQLSKDAEQWNNPMNLVFTEENGRYCIPHVVYLNFKKVADKIGLPEARFHDLRHSCATALLANGASLTTVQKTLRHSNASTTMRYVHCTEEMMKDGANRMDAFFKKVQTA